MIVRDEHQIIVQHNPNDPNYKDGGDSSRATGIMALCGSEKDKKIILKHYIGKGLCVRHPYQPRWSDFRNFSRDQLILLVAGLLAAGYYFIVRKIFWSRFRSFFFCQNTHTNDGLKKKFPDGADILSPDVIWHMILCGRMWYLYWFFPVGILFQFLVLLFNCFVTPWREQNQTFALMSVSGLLPLYLRLHPDFEKAMKDYWCKWRSQEEVFEKIMAKIRS